MFSHDLQTVENCGRRKYVEQGKKFWYICRYQDVSSQVTQTLVSSDKLIVVHKHNNPEDSKDERKLGIVRVKKPQSKEREKI